MTDQPNLFDEDELALHGVDPNWTEKELLGKEGIFFLKDIVKVLDLDSLKVKRAANDLEKRGKSAWDILGARKVWNHWIVRMKVFAPYYRAKLRRITRYVDPAWDGNELLRQRGLFLLTDVCQLLPFSTHQLRYQAKRNPHAKEEYGVWKEPSLHAFVVDMEPFAKWVTRLWQQKHGSQKND